MSTAAVAELPRSAREAVRTSPVAVTAQDPMISPFHQRVGLGYARVSTQEQNLDAQTDALEAAACDKVFVEHASGVLAKRPALDDALEYLREGDTLVVTKLDRLGRSVRNLKEVADGLERRGVGLKALSQGIDTTTPGGRLFFHMLAATAFVDWR